MEHRKTILLVFPGLGKTYAALRIPGVVDCDYGYYRTALGNKFKLVASTEVNCFTQKVSNIYLKEGFVVLTNEPALIPWLKQIDADIFMVLPCPNIDMGTRILERESHHPVNKDFAISYDAHWREWVTGWRAQAQKYNIPIFTVKYLFDDLVFWVSSHTPHTIYSTLFEDPAPWINEWAQTRSVSKIGIEKKGE